MDGTSVWPRTAPGGRPAAHRPRTAAALEAAGSGIAQSAGVVDGQAMTADQAPTVGVYFGTTSGEIWGSRDEGRSWKCLTAHLPHVYAVETG